MKKNIFLIVAMLFISTTAVSSEMKKVIIWTKKD
jgi:hypothetical protein